MAVLKPSVPSKLTYIETAETLHGYGVGSVQTSLATLRSNDRLRRLAAASSEWKEQT